MIPGDIFAAFAFLHAFFLDSKGGKAFVFKYQYKKI